LWIACQVKWWWLPVARNGTAESNLSSSTASLERAIFAVWQSLQRERRDVATETVERHVYVRDVHSETA
jgi:hypothetical protein